MKKTIIKRKFMKIVVLSAIFHSLSLHAFSKLRYGFETLTDTYLVPLATAIGGASLIIYVILSYFQSDYSRRIFQVFFLSILVGAGSEIIKLLIQAFS